ncbi:MAG TPA: EFR1 family ferrodoxin [Candidatus Kapabacteria bacterium]|nr:EFR1 family ferrodoxin [Candidatus Kapabacteria bacterium]
MKTIIYYYTGTGNSLWTARQLAAEIGDAELRPMVHPDQPANETNIAAPDIIGIVFPVHMWGIPHRVLEFLKRMEKNPSCYYFAAGVNAGQVSRTLVQLKKLLASYGLTLSAAYDIVLPSNYIPWGGPGPIERQQALFKAAAEKIEKVGPIIKAREKGSIEKGPLWQRIIFTALYKMSFGQVPKMDKDFWVDEKCNACGICINVCPVQNIVLQAGKPVWQHRCEQCLSCIQWCPRESIQYGKKTPGYERYHHPEVKLKDILFEPLK